VIALLSPEQVSNGWRDVEYALKASIPVEKGDSPSKFNNILTLLLTNEMQAWASWRPGPEGTPQITGLIVSRILRDDIADSNNVLVYSVYSLDTTRDEWITGMQTFFDYYESKNCTRVVGYTKVESIMKHAKDWGADVSAFISYTL
jgi:hypothetical protein